MNATRILDGLIRAETQRCEDIRQKSEAASNTRPRKRAHYSYNRADSDSSDSDSSDSDLSDSDSSYYESSDYDSSDSETDEEVAEPSPKRSRRATCPSSLIVTDRPQANTVAGGRMPPSVDQNGKHFFREVLKVTLKCFLTFVL